MLQIGDKAPEFEALDTHGEPIRLADFRGRPLVLYFYPKDNTPGCTAEACDFRDQHPAFTELGCDVIGVSRDSVKSHQNFTAKHELPFRLVSDPDGKVCEAYGVLGEKVFCGRRVFGIRRTTYVIDGAGVVRAVFENVKVKGHVAQVLAALREIATEGGS